MTDEEQKINSYADIDGWFTPVDKFVFDAILSNQIEHGTLVELGAYLGRSAVVIADHQRPDERFVVVDLFGDDSELDRDRANRRENTQSYETLSRGRFEQNFLALHPTLPEVVQGLSTVISEHVAPGTARFVHIDASHLYDNVTEDIATAAELVQPQGVVVLDDYRSPHTPGVAAATWEAVREGGLKPFAITPHKLYATWGDPQPYRELVTRLATDDPELSVATHSVREHTMARVFVREAQIKRAQQLAREQQARDRAEAARAAAASSRTSLRTVLRDWTPPAVARWVRNRRRAPAARPE